MPLRFAVNHLRSLIALISVPVIAVAIEAATIGFDIHLVTSGDLTPVTATAFSRAASRWESLITGYQDTLTSEVLIVVAEEISIDGPGGALGTGYPAAGKFGGEENFLYAAAGYLTLDRDDTALLSAANLLDDLVAHELGHVIGLGTMWSSAAAGVAGFQELYAVGSGQYTGAGALAKYRRDYDPTAAFVPVELDGGPGSADVHWSKAALGDDIMTGVLNGPVRISSVTRGALRDLGYTLVPEANPRFLITVLALVVSATRRRGYCNATSG